ncbi:spermatogenesis-associated protein 22 [Sminthopsis crassicaudata]|uniref:spermatogenesis-associated protein 22 n=1 Tax=Sminthopsis crassicaudata TaxID=9301 RepID=UPI003D6931EE
MRRCAGAVATTARFHQVAPVSPSICESGRPRVRSVAEGRKSAPAAMKKSAPGGFARLTAGCLPVPLFNQKKRVRQPFTSGPGAVSEAQDFPPLPPDFVWEMMKPEVPPLPKMGNAGRPAVPPRKPGNGFTPGPVDEARSHNWSNWGFGEAGPKAWDRSEFAPPRKSVDAVAGSGPGPGLGPLETNQNWRQSSWAPAEVCRAPYPPRMAGAPGSGGGAPQAPKSNPQPSHLKRKAFGRGPEEKALKEVPVCQLRLKEDGPSLRILPAVIESMKHWRERLPHCPLLFEVLAVLDSAVTPGAQGAKTFLLRDGRSTVPCVFYEIDRELPRLIRGRVHRCVGSFDQKKGLLRCVSVRPASASEQETFPELVRSTDAKLSRNTSAAREM